MNLNLDLECKPEINLNIDVNGEVEEIEKIFDLLLSLETKMLEWNMTKWPVKVASTGKSVNYSSLYDRPRSDAIYKWDNKLHKPVLHYGDREGKVMCSTCAYESLRVNESPCNTCGIEVGEYNNWKERTEEE